MEENKACIDHIGGRLVPPRLRVLSGSLLKVIAMVSMLIDHVAHLFRIGEGVMIIPGLDYTWYECLRHVGRMAFPLFAFLLVEGFIHTRNRKKYGINLLIFAAVSEIPFDLFCSGRFLYERQNVFFTLLVGFLALCAIEGLRGKQRIFCVLGLFGISMLLGADYKYTGFVFILLLYALRSIPLLRSLMTSCVLSLPAGAASLPIAFYNGERGFIKGGIWKYAFYAFYPLHLLLLVLIKVLF